MNARPLTSADVRLEDAIDEACALLVCAGTAQAKSECAEHLVKLIQQRSHERIVAMEISRFSKVLESKNILPRGRQFTRGMRDPDSGDY